MTEPRDDLDHLPDEVAGRIRAHLAVLHRGLAECPRDEIRRREPVLAAILDLGVDVAFLVQLHAREIGRLHRALVAARVATVLAVVAAGVALGMALR